MKEHKQNDQQALFDAPAPIHEPDEVPESDTDVITDAESGVATESAPLPDEPATGEKVIIIPPQEDALAKAQAQAQEYLELAQRTRADLENYRKRVLRDRESDRQTAIADFIRDLLTPVNDLDRALIAADKDKQFDALRNGLGMIHAAIWKLFDARSVKRIPTKGQLFDPHVHEAMLQMPSAEFAAGTVVDEIGPGYIMNDICLQPAKVIVSAGNPAAVCGEDEAQAGATEE